MIHLLGLLFVLGLSLNYHGLKCKKKLDKKALISFRLDTWFSTLVTGNAGIKFNVHSSVSGFVVDC